MSNLSNYLIIFLVVPILVPLIGKIITTKGGERLSTGELNRLFNTKYPLSAKSFYSITVIFLLIGIFIGFFIPKYLLFDLARKDNFDGLSGIFRFIIFMLFSFANLMFFSWAIDTFFYKIASKEQKDYLTYIQARSGFQVTMKSGLLLMLKIAAILYLVTLSLFIVGISSSILKI